MSYAQRPAPVHPRLRLQQALMDWNRRILQLSAFLATIIVAYLLYHLAFGALTQWTSMTAQQQRDTLAILQQAILWLNLCVTLIIVTLCIQWYDEPSLGLTLAMVGAALYFGFPILLEQIAGQPAGWSQQNNQGAMAIYNALRVLGLIAMVPGGLFLLRDLYVLVVERSRRREDDRAGMRYGSAADEEQAPPSAWIGMFAKCWQLSYCREYYRLRCPIFYARRRCWQERVGCMCEENAIRTSLARLFPDWEGERPSYRPNVQPLTEAAEEPAIGQDVTQQARPVVSRTTPLRIAPKDVRIPSNPSLSIEVKRERCRHCVIFMEHQRLKYQFLAPLCVLLVPGVAALYFRDIKGTLGSLLEGADRVMARLSLDPNIREVGFGTAVPASAQYVLMACLVVIATTMVLRFLEYTSFRLKV
ncbi:MAG TPA: hypothetical protein VLH79_00395 [Chthonomonadales bacterium]|nr:hypothetical protein [Chthonomonadales bacterium]